MHCENCERRIYIVVTQTGTVLSRILKIITGAEYNHASVSLDPALKKMYSFGRVNPYNPWWGGFVIETPRGGTFGRFPKTNAVILELGVEEDTYEEIKAFLEEMYEKRADYHYNSVGLVLAAFGLHFKPRNCYYCSEFVREVLTRFDLVGKKQFSPIVKPIHFLSIPHAHEIYRGRLLRYRGM